MEPNRIQTQIPNHLFKCFIRGVVTEIAPRFGGKNQVKKLTQAVQNTVPALSEALESLRPKMPVCPLLLEKFQRLVKRFAS
jgi:hypothetical protein